MKRNITRSIAGIVLLATLSVSGQALAKDAITPYTSMAPIEQYLMPDRDAEIALARSAAPEPISRDAEVLVLERHGFETAVKGKNGFVCVVQRSWSAGTDDPDFWNPKLRGPICFNSAAARFNIPLTIKRTQSILANKSKTRLLEDLQAAFDKQELPALEPGAMCFMLAKQGYLGDRNGHWHPHLMFFTSQIEPAMWGADVPDSPVIGIKDAEDRMTVFLIPLAKWSDGTMDPADAH